MITSVKEQIQEQDILVEELVGNDKFLIVWNDEVNTFDHVIDTLIAVCKHNKTQAEQCTWLIHTKGKCDVRKGSFDALRPMAEAIIDRGINATIE
jgi:ATP-dependent Clp protease adaptor protein ClpS